MWRIRQALARIMYGRSGIDRLYWYLLTVWLILSILNIFFGSYIINALELIVIFYAIYRVMSKNILRRQAENMAVLRMTETIKKWCKLQFSRIREIKYKRYRKCKSCGAVLRLPIRKGKHTVCCPKCKKEFEVKISF